MRTNQQNIFFIYIDIYYRLQQILNIFDKYILNLCLTFIQGLYITISKADSKFNAYEAVCGLREP